PEVPEAGPPPFPELFDRPAAPGPGEPEPVPDAASWLPALDDPAPGTPSSPSPMFTTSFGSASVQRPPRRLWPWALLAAGLVLAAAAFLLRGRIVERTGL